MYSVGISDRLKRFEYKPDIVEETSFNDFVMEALSKRLLQFPCGMSMIIQSNLN